MPLVDSHAHLFSDAFQRDLQEVLLRASQASLEAIVCIATNPQELELGLNFQESPLPLFHVGGTTPHEVETLGEADFPYFETKARERKLCGIGETGLDYHYEHSNREIQKAFFRRYLRLAKSTQLPIVIHCREAFEDLFQILDEEYVENGNHLPGVLHCFTGTLKEAKEVVARGLYLSLSGIVTFKKSEELKKVAAQVPLEKLLIETDAPYLAPDPFRGKKNEPVYLQATAECLAKIKQISFEELAVATASNAKQLFRLN